MTAEGKHRGRPPHDTPRGPDRWVRAAMNAARDPNSKAAQLYMSRLSNAFAVTQEARESGELDPLTPFAFRDRDYSTSSPKGSIKREAVTCSVHCTVMHMQLRFHVTDLEQIRKRFSEKIYGSEELVVIRLETADLVRPVKCAACGSKVRPAGK